MQWWWWLTKNKKRSSLNCDAWSNLKKKNGTKNTFIWKDEDVEFEVDNVCFAHSLSLCKHHIIIFSHTMKLLHKNLTQYAQKHLNMNWNLKNNQNQEFPSFNLLFFLFYHFQPKFDESYCLLLEHWVMTVWISLLCFYFNHVEIFSTIVGIHEVSSQKVMGPIFH